MDSINFKNVEKYKEEDHSIDHQQSSTPSQSNSNANSPNTAKGNKTDHHQTIFQIWLKDLVDEHVINDLDMNDLFNHTISSHFDHPTTLNPFKLELNHNRMFLDRQQQQREKDNHSATNDSHTCTESSKQSLSRISEESQLVISETTEKPLDSCRLSIVLEGDIGSDFRQDKSRFLRSDTVQDEVEVSEIYIQSTSILPTVEEVEDPKPRQSLSPTKRKVAHRSKTITHIQLNHVISPQTPQNVLQTSPKASRRKSTRVQRSLTLSNEDKDSYFNIYEKGIVRKAFVKTSKNKISYIFNQLINRNSQLSFDMKRFTRNKTQQFVKTIKVQYLDVVEPKKFAFPKEISACEFLHKAIRGQKKQDQQNLEELRYPQYPLAYRLESTEEHRNPFRSSVVQQLSSKNQTNSQLLSIEKEFEFEFEFESELTSDRIVIQPESPINFSLVYLVEEDPSTFSDKLQQMLLQNQTILQIEDPCTWSFYYLQVQQHQTVRDLLDMMHKEDPQTYTKQEYCLRLKFQCLSFAEQILPPQLPIQALPIQWLEIVKIKEQELTPLMPKLKKYLSEKIDSSEMLSQLHFPIDKRIPTQQQLRDPADIDRMMKIYPTLYSLEEFDMIKLKNNIREQVIVSIDYFDFYYIHKAEKQKSKKSLYQKIRRYFKKGVQLLLEDYDYHQHTYKKFPLHSIISYKLEGNQLHVQFEKNSTPQKTLLFEIDPNFIKLQKNDEVFANEKLLYDKGIQKLQLIYGKLKFLMQQQCLGDYVNLY